MNRRTLHSSWHLFTVSLLLGNGALGHALTEKQPRLHNHVAAEFDNLAFEQAQFVSTAKGLRITGTVPAAQSGLPLRADYRIECDEQWKTAAIGWNNA